MAYGNSGVGEFIELVGKLPLGDPTSGVDYSEIFSDVVNLSGVDPFQVICGRLVGQPRRNLALIVACIWARYQVGEETEPRVVEAERFALKIMEREGIAPTAEALMSLLRTHRESFRIDYGSDMMVVTNAVDHARVATMFLQRLVV